MKNILITGASSGIGSALALIYAADNVNLFLSGRNKERLESVANKAKEKGAVVKTNILDVSNHDLMKKYIEEIDSKYPLDLVIANAGISAGTGNGKETEDQSNAIFETNVFGVFNTIRPAISAMEKRGKGQIAIMSSLAGFRGLAGAPSYMASKATIRVYGESLRLDYAEKGIKVNVICPGFVKTPMTDVNKFPMPFLISPKRAAKIIKNGLKKNKARISFPLPMSALVWFLFAMPASLIDMLAKSFPKKD